ncbi:Nramp family divalent metal transporter [Pseudomonas sp. CCI3.2]|uniref:Nramp family divalent metal transporter n=1 Tax=unclassified Pseudomonas TaxID=196821 RepID=UPI002AC9353E|nr:MULTISPECIES: Nramp family divalent metal transporter [unclassified Pseudomonas]MEB0078465.1 Nramp family divalent metal transporter [Pseudomonas sp. MH10out]MEB0090129.1 Nramp family divalent metal transporter [Pseudomonas sp. CCI4.2]MEB0103979.1 Nramp family divalent metal transporter [Pseudomonas sp. CCI3.2]MEB0131752.1 Nramp family divalent metal transporter [Pseudomonas sp. CCI2.4]MEB0158088.1 Nramp family divalent metal transporter [Pseudomonas sp. AH2 (2023)]
MKFSLPKLATAPFCPPEVAGSVAVDSGAVFWKRALKFAGPGLLISIGYMDPGNWATAIEAGSRYGYDLLFVVLLASLAGMALQCLCSRLGIATGRDLAQLCRERYSTRSARTQWVLAEISIIATDLAEVLGCALAFHLLLGISLTFGIALTAFDTLLVLALQNRGFRRLEAIMLVLVLTIGVCFFIELLLIKPYWPDVFHGFKPSFAAISGAAPLYLAIGILGATVMPHNLYLHTSVVQTRLIGKDLASRQDAVRLSRIDTIGSLTLALLVNAAILILAAAAFHQTGHTGVVEIQDAYHLLDPLVDGTFASLLFGIALLASGQSSTFTGTIAGQVIMEGFLNLRIPCWQRRLITRGLALIPAFTGVWLMGDDAVGKLLILSQVVLSLQLPFALYPLIRMTNDKRLMGPFVNNLPTRLLAWSLFAVISVANIWLIAQLLH